MLRTLTQAWVATPFSVLYVPLVIYRTSALDTSESWSNTGLDRVLQPIDDFSKKIGYRYRVCQLTEHGHYDGLRLILLIILHRSADLPGQQCFNRMATGIFHSPRRLLQFSLPRFDLLHAAQPRATHATHAARARRSQSHGECYCSIGEIFLSSRRARHTQNLCFLPWRCQLELQG